MAFSSSFHNRLAFHPKLMSILSCLCLSCPFVLAGWDKNNPCYFLLDKAVADREKERERECSDKIEATAASLRLSHGSLRMSYLVLPAKSRKLLLFSPRS